MNLIAKDSPGLTAAFRNFRISLSPEGGTEDEEDVFPECDETLINPTENVFDQFSVGEIKYYFHAPTEPIDILAKIKPKIEDYLKLAKTLHPRRNYDKQMMELEELL